MSIWRKKALEMLPELHKIITDDSVTNQMALWLEFRAEFEESENQDFRSRMYAYARWSCFHSNNGDTVTAVCCAFYEHLPENRVSREEMIHEFTRKEFQELEHCFRYHQTEEEALELRKLFVNKKK